ncbi:MAG: hypothetical protein LBD30_03200 [Verrucomicrobiales bacterium]|nr:hypothetical protein [Verrucomicrobiales bacterium]
MKLLGIVHQLYGTDNHELQYSYVNVDHIAYLSKFQSGDIKTRIVLADGTTFYSIQDVAELQREFSTREERTTSSPFLI